MKHYNTNKKNVLLEIKNNSIKLFYEQGYNKTTLRQIGEASGIKHSTVLYYYRKKEELAKWMLTRYFNGTYTYAYKTAKAMHSSYSGISIKTFSIALFYALHYNLLYNQKKFAKFYIDFYYAAKDVFRQTLDKVEYIVNNEVSEKIISTQYMLDESLSYLMDIMLVEYCLSEKIIPDEASVYFTLNNIYAKTGYWDQDLREMEVLIKECNKIVKELNIDIYYDILSNSDYDDIKPKEFM